MDRAAACTASMVPVRLTSITRCHSSMVNEVSAAPGWAVSAARLLMCRASASMSPLRCEP